jgi:hypothetical protein
MENNPALQLLRAEIFIFGFFFKCQVYGCGGVWKKMKRGSSIRLNLPQYVITVPSSSDSILLRYSGFSLKDLIFSEILFSVLF